MEYKRMTHRNGKNIEEYCEVGHCKYADKNTCILKDFQHNVDDECVPAMIERLAELEDKIEQGTLIELPCKLGDTVWTINCWQEYGKKELGERYIVTRYELHENKCSCIEVNDKNHYLGEISIRAKESYKGVTPYIFLTREEAEAKLKELQE